MYLMSCKRCESYGQHLEERSATYRCDDLIQSMTPNTNCFRCKLIFSPETGQLMICMHLGPVRSVWEVIYVDSIMLEEHSVGYHWPN